MFESQQRVVDFSHLFVANIFGVRKNRKNKQKEARDEKITI